MEDNMKVFVVNMDTRPDRWAYISEQLDNFNIEYERIPAIVGKELREEEQKLFNKKKFLLNQKKHCVPGEIGCAMSHRLIWNRVINDNLEHALILEDDVKLNPLLLEFLAKKQHYQKFDMLNLSSNEPYQLTNLVSLNLEIGESIERPNFTRSSKRKSWQKNEWRRRWRIFSITKIFEDLYTLECDPAPALTSGYIVSKKGAKHLLETSKEMFYPVDLTWRHSGGCLVEGFVSQVLILQALDETDIHGRYSGYKLSQFEKIQRVFIKSRRTKRRKDLIRMYGLSKLL